MADGNIKLYGKLKSVTEEGKVADYSEIDGVPIIMHDLSASEFTPTANTYYLHTGETTVAYDNGTIYFYNGTNYTSITGSGLFNDFGLTQGDQKYSIVQKRIKSDGSTVTTKAYQRGTAAFGGSTVAGDQSGTATDYSFAFAANENNEAIARSSAAFGRYNKTFNPGEFVCGNYSDNNRNPETVFLVGGGANNERRHNAFEVRTSHTGGSEISNAFIGGKMVATQEYVSNTAVHKEGTPYVVYINEAGDKSTIMPYRFNKQSIVDSEFTLMFQPMHNGRLYTRDPEDDYHAANKRFVNAGLANKLDKTGGTISGKMFFYNNLNVIGGHIYCNMTPTSDTEVVRLAELKTRLNKPSGNPTEDSFVKVSSTGTVSWEKVTKLYQHEIHAANALFKLIVINNSSAKITTFTSLVGVNYVSMYVGTPACTPVVELSIIYEGAGANEVGIKVGWNLDGLNFIQYLDSNLESDTVIEL